MKTLSIFIRQRGLRSQHRWIRAHRIFGLSYLKCQEKDFLESRLTINKLDCNISTVLYQQRSWVVDQTSYWCYIVRFLKLWIAAVVHTTFQPYFISSDTWWLILEGIQSAMILHLGSSMHQCFIPPCWILSAAALQSWKMGWWKMIKKEEKKLHLSKSKLWNNYS